jgi:hypothetical protein
MNGWQRIGALASVAWFFGAWWCAGGVQQEKYDRSWLFSYRLCREVPHDSSRDFEQSKECIEKATQHADMMCCNGSGIVHDPSREAWATWFAWRHQEQLFFGVILIPFGWLIVYICIWLARWVRRGFAKT